MHADADFLAAVAANPQDPLTRLVYADWLDENCDPRGELVRIEEEARFEPAWSDVLWRQKPRRNELRATCDPAWLQAMRYGTGCLPLFYGRPFPDDWRDGWRLIREATERWLGHPMPDIGGHADEVSEVEERIGRKLPHSVREFVAFSHDLSRRTQGYMRTFRDEYTMVVVPDQPAVSLILQAEGDVHWGTRFRDLRRNDPPVHSYLDGMGESDERFILSDHAPSPTLTEFFFQYAILYAPRSRCSIKIRIRDVEAAKTTLAADFAPPTQLRTSFPFATSELSYLYEVTNALAWLKGDRLTFEASRTATAKLIHNAVWELFGDRKGPGVFAKRPRRKR